MDEDMSEPDGFIGRIRALTVSWSYPIVELLDVRKAFEREFAKAMEAQRLLDVERGPVTPCPISFAQLHQFLRDAPCDAILRHLAQHQGSWSSHFDGWSSNGVHLVTPFMTERFRLAVMRRLYRRGMVGGCACGCRGDWEITDKGLASVGIERTVAYNGY